MSYTIESHEHGVLVTGSLPIDDLNHLHRLWKKRGWTLMAPGIAHALGGTMAVTNEEHLEPWRKECEAKAAAQARGDRVMEWILGTDTGISSLTICEVLCPEHSAAARARVSSPDVPHDPADFGRCHRLLERFPGWRERLPEVAAEHPNWARLVDGWEEITRLYLEELPTGRAPRCYELIQECVR